MKILHLTPHLNAGGMTSYIRTLAKGSIQRKHHVHVVTSGGECVDELKALGVHVHLFDIRTKSILSPKIFKTVGFLKKLIEEQGIQVVHAHTRVTQCMADKVCRKRGCVFVSTCHGYFRPHFFRKLWPCWGEAIIAISREVVTHLQDDFNVPSDKIVLVETGIDINHFKEGTPEQKKERQQELHIQQDLVVGSIARLSDVKGIDVLIEAIPVVLRQRKNIQFVIIGQGKEAAVLKERVKALHIEQHVFFLDAVSQTAKYLPIYDIFVVPSRSEGLGLSALEAQACGLPVIASDVGGLRSVVTHEENGLLVPAENPEKLAEAILRLADDKVLREKLGQQAREFVQERFHADRMVEKILNLYARLMV